MSSFWQYQGRQSNRKKYHPEYIVKILMGHDGGLTRYRIAKESGLSWPTINRVSRLCDLDYRRKTKQRLKALIQV